MTRLTTPEVASVPGSLEVIDAHLRRLCGGGLPSLAARAASPPWGSDGGGVGVADLSGLIVGVVPVTAGEGCIPGFVEAVEAVCRFVGSEVFVTERTDIDGIARAVECRADVVLAADDERFMAFDVQQGGCVDNGPATGEVYAAVLDAATGGVRGRRVLVVGLGPVGMAASAWLCGAGGLVVVHEPDRARAEMATRSLPVTAVDSLEQGLLSCDLVLLAAPRSDLVDVRWVTDDRLVAAPGIPLGVTEDARRALGDRLVHEPLALGVAAMLAKITAGRRARPAGGVPGRAAPSGVTSAGLVWPAPCGGRRNRVKGGRAALRR